MAIVVTVARPVDACWPPPSPTAGWRVRLLVAAVLLTVNWTGYVWAVANDRVLETALGYFMAPLATMLLGIPCSASRRPGCTAPPSRSPPPPSSC